MLRSIESSYSLNGYLRKPFREHLKKAVDVGSIIAPKQKSAGKIEIVTDDKIRKTVSLSAATRQSQQIVFWIDKLGRANHTINVINRGSGQVSINALVVPNAL